MAVCTRGMTPAETLALTRTMVASGEVLDLGAIDGIKVDKHSTGGVGDKVTLIAAPLAAACGVKVPKLSGRALAHTGGTLDKLESVPGLEVELPPERFIKQVREVGIAVAAQSPRMVPADKLLYALRDVTGTVPSLPLIASSIMSKKIAAGADAIVLDVKVGLGAFMTHIEEAKQLARIMVDIGRSVGRRVVALISDMNQPLGYAVGNALEVEEAVDCLKRKGSTDLREHCLATAAHMLRLARNSTSEFAMTECLAEAADRLNNGAALDKLKIMVRAQGGDVSMIDDTSKLPKAQIVETIPAQKNGYVAQLNAQQ